MAMRLTVSKMCEALDLGVAPSVPAAKKRRPVYSPDFISVGGRVREADSPPKKGAKPKKTPKALPPLVGRGTTTTPSPLRFVNLPYAVPASPKPSVPLPRAVEKLECVRNSKLTLKDHQLRVVNHFQTNRGLIVAHPVGSGKTLEGVTVASCFLMKHPDGVVKVVTPVSLQHNFEKELLAAGVRSDRIELYTLAAFATQHGPGGAKEGTCASRSAKKRRPVLLIIDEAHELRTNISKARNSGKTVRAEVAVRCAMEADEVLLLTATAVYNEPYDIASLVAMVKGTVPLSVKSFESLVYEDEKRGPTQDQKRRFADYFGCMFSFHDMPRDSNYPTVIERYIEIEMSAQYFKEYKEVERRNSSLFSGANPFLFLSGVRRASNALSSCPKCDVVMDFVQKGLPVSVTAQGIPQFGTIAAMKGKKPIKVVVYSAFREFGVDQISERLRSAGIPYGEVNGSMPKDKRQKAVDGYNADKLQVLLITAAGGQGLDLKGTRVIILFEEQWNSSIEDQAKGRAVRYGSHSHLPESERSVQIYHLVMIKPRSSKDKRPSADTILKELVEEKRAKNVKFLKRLQEVSIEKLACGSFPITPAATNFLPVTAPKDKKITAKKGRTWAKVLDLAKKIFARGGDYQESNDDFDLVIGTNVIALQHRSRTGDVWLETNKKGEIFATLPGEKPVGYAKGDTIPSKIEKSATLLEDLLEDLLFKTRKLEKEEKRPPTPSPPRKMSNLDFHLLFERAYESVKNHPDWKKGGSAERFKEPTFLSKFAELNLERGSERDGKWMALRLQGRWSTTIYVQSNGDVDTGFNNESETNFEYSDAPSNISKKAVEALEFLVNLSGSLAGEKEFLELYERAYTNVKRAPERDWALISGDGNTELFTFIKPEWAAKYGDSFAAKRKGSESGKFATLGVMEAGISADGTVWNKMWLANLWYSKGRAKVYFFGGDDGTKFKDVDELAIKSFRHRLEILSKLRFSDSASPLPKKPSPPKPSIVPVGLAVVKKSPPKGEKISKLDFVRLFMEAWENTKGLRADQITIETGKAFPDTAVFKITISVADDRMNLFYTSSGQRWLTGLVIENSGNTTVSFSNSSKDVPFEDVPARVLAAAVERLEFLRDLTVESEEYFMDVFYERFVRVFDQIRIKNGKKEINWTKIPGSNGLEFSLVGKILVLRGKKLGEVSYNAYTDKLIFVDAKGQRQNPYILGDSKFGKWLSLREHPKHVQIFHKNMNAAVGELENYLKTRL